MFVAVMENFRNETCLNLVKARLLSIELQNRLGPCVINAILYNSSSTWWALDESYSCTKSLGDGELLGFVERGPSVLLGVIE
jgi:hypothetical protein